MSTLRQALLHLGCKVTEGASFDALSRDERQKQDLVIMPALSLCTRSYGNSTDYEHVLILQLVDPKSGVLISVAQSQVEKSFVKGLLGG